MGKNWTVSKPRSDEWRRKQSEAHKGQFVSKEERKNKSKILTQRWRNGFKGQTGIKLCEERKKFLSLHFKNPELQRKAQEARIRLGYRHSIGTREKLRLSKLGSKNPMWKGGVIKENELIRHSSSYRSWRLSVFKRDDFTCQMPECEKRGGILNANHIKKFSDYPELRLLISNGITLCEECHKITKWHELEFENLFTETLKNQLTPLQAN